MLDAELLYQLLKELSDKVDLRGVVVLRLQELGGRLAPPVEADALVEIVRCLDSLAEAEVNDLDDTVMSDK